MRYISFATLILIARTASATYWHPTAGTPWQIILSQPLTAPYPVGIKAIDGDLYTNDASTWADIRSRGIKTICYFSAGSYEDWRPDAGDFHNGTDIGDPLEGWEGEWWINTKSDNVRNIMKQRLDLAVQKGCDAVDPDNIDAYDNGGGGFGLTEDDAVDYITFLATEAHSRNMAVGLKNGGAIVDRVVGKVDFQVNEQCEQYGECSTFRPFITANKPVFGIEYTDGEDTIPDQDKVDNICTNTDSRGFSTLIKHMNLDKWLIACSVTATSVNSTTASEGPSAFTGAAGKYSVAHAASLLTLLLAGMSFL